LNEQERLDRLRALFGAAPIAGGVTVGIGDDAAVLAAGGAPLVWTIDAAVEGVHFRREWMSFADVGWRSLMAAASDLAAMGASPRGVLSSLVLPDDFGDDDLEALARGQADAARELGTSIVGGNLSRGGELSITTCVLGEAPCAVLRSGARQGDVVAIAGAAGLSRAGLLALARGERDARLAIAIDVFRRPRARVAEGIAAARNAHAAIDLSDGLAIDVSRLANASGVGVVLEEDLVLGAGGTALAAAAAALGVDAVELALYGGEDYALVMTFDPGAVQPGFERIGRCVESRGIWLESAGEELRAIEARGFDHFQKSTSM
jgi:thiamine-monophosphate kinase